MYVLDILEVKSTRRNAEQSSCTCSQLACGVSGWALPSQRGGVAVILNQNAVCSVYSVTLALQGKDVCAGPGQRQECGLLCHGWGVQWDHQQDVEIRSQLQLGGIQPHV